MKQKEQFKPTDYLRSDELVNIDISSVSDLGIMLDALKNDYSSVINTIFGQTNEVAQILEVPYTNITDERNLVKYWVGVIVPVLTINNEGNVLTVLSEFAVASFGIKLLKMISEGVNEEEIFQFYQAFELFKNLYLKNNGHSIKWKFTPQKSGCNFKKFAKIMKVKV